MVRTLFDSVAVAIAGGALGLLLGLLVSLSQTSVVGSLISALVAGLGAYLGFSESSQTPSSAAEWRRNIRLSAFALFCVFGIGVGLYTRVNNLMMVPIAQEISTLKDAGFDQSEALRLAALRHYGVVPAERTISQNQIANSTLFSRSDRGSCDQIIRLRDLSDQIAAMISLGGEWASLASHVLAQPESSRPGIVSRALKEKCP